MTHASTILTLLAFPLLILAVPACIDLPTAQDGGEQSEMGSVGEDMADMAGVWEDMSRVQTRKLGKDSIQLNGGACAVNLNDEGCFVNSISGQNAIISDVRTRQCEKTFGQVTNPQRPCEPEPKKPAYLLGLSRWFSIDSLPSFYHSSVFFSDPLKIQGGSVRIKAKVLVNRIYERDLVLFDYVNYGAFCITLHTDEKGSKAMGSTGRFWGVGSIFRESAGERYDPSREQWDTYPSSAFVVQPDGGGQNVESVQGRGEGIDSAICAGASFEFEYKIVQGEFRALRFYNRWYNIPATLKSRFTPLYKVESENQEVLNMGSEIYAEKHPFATQYQLSGAPSERSEEMTLNVMINSNSIKMEVEGSDGTVPEVSSAVLGNFEELKERLTGIMRSNRDVYVGVTASTAGGGMNILLRDLSVEYTPQLVK